MNRDPGLIVIHEHAKQTGYWLNAAGWSYSISGTLYWNENEANGFEPAWLNNAFYCLKKRGGLTGRSGMAYLSVRKNEFASPVLGKCESEFGQYGMVVVETIDTIDRFFFEQEKETKGE